MMASPRIVNDEPRITGLAIDTVEHATREPKHDVRELTAQFPDTIAPDARHDSRMEHLPDM